MGKPIYAFLEDFGDGEDHTPISLAGVAISAMKASQQSASAAASAEREEAYEKGLAAGRAEMQARMDVEVARIRSEAERRLEGAKSALVDSIAKQLSSGLRHELDALHDALAAQLASALTPVMEHLLTERAIAELVGEMRGLARDDAAISVELSGPAELIERIEQRYADLVSSSAGLQAPSVRMSPGTSVEVRIVQGSAVIETRLMEWIGRIMEATR